MSRRRVLAGHSGPAATRPPGPARPPGRPATRPVRLSGDPGGEGTDDAHHGSFGRKRRGYGAIGSGRRGRPPPGEPGGPPAPGNLSVISWPAGSLAEPRNTERY